MKRRVYKRKYRGYWISIEEEKETYSALLWISGHPEVKLVAVQNAFSASLAERIAEIKIDKTLSISGVLS